jgi:crotonobetainyl-CoA:carnitine CoA-transferase CaiB-like acyl-CoA transferase
VHDLVRECDVVLSNFKGGTLEALGLDYRTLKQINPRIILVDSSAYGSFGPWSKRMGYGPLVRASAGLTAQWRYPDEPNGYADGMTIYPDHVAARIGAIGVLALLIRRLTSGRGGQVGISQAEVMINHIASSAAIEALREAGHEIAVDQHRSQVLACAGDDEWCVVSTRGDDDANQIAKLVGAGELRDWVAARTPDEAAELLQSIGIAAAPMLRVADLPQHDYFIQRGYFRQDKHPYISEVLTLEAAPVRTDGLPQPPESPAPLLGEHSFEILEEYLGIPREEAGRLAEQGVIEQFGFSVAPA